jgi:hypothetical protein
MENCKGGCRLTLKKAGSGMVEIKVSHSSIEKGAFFSSFRVCSSSFHDLLREKPSSLFLLLG